MVSTEPTPETDLETALVECLRIFARRGRAIREATQKQNADAVSHPDSEDNTESVDDDSHAEGPDTLGILP